MLILVTNLKIVKKMFEKKILPLNGSGGVVVGSGVVGSGVVVSSSSSSSSSSTTFSVHSSVSKNAEKM